MAPAPTISRRQVILGTAGLAVMAVTAPQLRSRGALATVDIYVVTSGPLRLRSGPGLSYAVLASLPTGTRMEIIANGGAADGYEWVEVWVSSLNKTGFVARTFITRDGTSGGGGTFPIGSTVHVDTASGSGANMRSAPSITASVVRIIANGTAGTVQSGETSSGGYAWIKVTMGSTTGYMATTVLAAGSGSTTPPPSPEFAIGDWVTVSAEAVNLRSQPSTSSTVVMVLSRGRRLVVTGGPESADGYVWYQAQTTQQTGSVVGWVIGLALIPQHPETPGGGLLWDVGSVAYVNTDRLNLRSEPALSAAVVTVLPRDAALTITGSPVGADGYEWYPGTTVTGVSGWAAGQYMR